jgi:uncharacterized Rmd1/YagE family protein
MFRSLFRYYTKESAKRIKTIRDIKSGDDLQSSQIPMGFSQPMMEPFRARAYCTAESYDFKKLSELIHREYRMLPYMADEVYHVYLSKEYQEIKDSSTAVFQIDAETPQAFLFQNGTFVTWGATQEQSEKLLSQVKFVESNPVPMETEFFDYYVDISQPGGMSTDTIIIGEDLPPEQAKFVYSAGMSRSVKLAALENALETHLSKNKHIPLILLQGKKLPVSRDDQLRNLGELFYLRAQVNLNSELLDLPDFCWSSLKMEEYFDLISKNLDVRPRIAVFNKKLDYANEVAEVIRNHLHEQHSLKLEWAIIILISVEIAFSTLHYLQTGTF